MERGVIDDADSREADCAEYMEAIDGPVLTEGGDGNRTLRSAKRCCSRSFSTLSSRNVFSLVGWESWNSIKKDMSEKIA